jgi:shikimate kinase
MTDMNPVRVLMVGLMGAGKSRVGATLARDLRVDYLDNDVLLREQEGLGPVELAQLGRDVLHAAEERQLHALCDRGGAFVAGVAGSVADRPADCALMRISGTVVYLRAAPEVLAARVAADPARPFIGQDPLPFITGTYEQRDPVFRAAAHLTVECDRPVEDVVRAIRDHLRR